jgi:membrane dipeptidase
MTNPIVFDGHCDTAAELFRKHEELADNTGMVSLKLARQLGGYLQFYAFCTCWQNGPETAAAEYQAMLPFFQAQLARYAGQISLCRTADEALAALSAGRCGAFLSIEGAESISCDPGLLDEAWAQGIRMITLTWNHRNALAGSCRTGEGLSAQGREFVRRAQKLGILLDVSHLSDRAFWDLCEISEKPIVASHSNSRAVCANARNLTDEQFGAICRLGGTAGLTLYRDFLSEKPAAFEDVYRHLDHFLSLGGEGHVALGGDLDGCDELPEGFSSVASYPALWRYLAGKGYSEQTLTSLFSGALLDVLRKCL